MGEQEDVHLLPARHSHSQPQSSSGIPSSINRAQTRGVGTGQTCDSCGTVVRLRFSDPQTAIGGIDGAEVDCGGGVGGEEGEELGVAREGQERDEREGEFHC